MLPKLKKLWGMLMVCLFRLILLCTFLGILPIIAYIYYNVYYANFIRAIMGCVVLITIAHINKSVQGGK